MPFDSKDSHYEKTLFKHLNKFYHRILFRIWKKFLCRTEQVDSTLNQIISDIAKHTQRGIPYSIQINRRNHRRCDSTNHSLFKITNQFNTIGWWFHSHLFCLQYTSLTLRPNYTSFLFVFIFNSFYNRSINSQPYLYDTTTRLQNTNESYLFHSISNVELPSSNHACRVSNIPHFFLLRVSLELNSIPQIPPSFPLSELSLAIHPMQMNSSSKINMLIFTSICQTLYFISFHLISGISIRILQWRNGRYRCRCLPTIHLLRTYTLSSTSRTTIPFSIASSSNRLSRSFTRLRSQFIPLFSFRKRLHSVNDKSPILPFFFSSLTFISIILMSFLLSSLK